MSLRRDDTCIVCTVSIPSVIRSLFRYISRDRVRTELDSLNPFVIQVFSGSNQIILVGWIHDLSQSLRNSGLFRQIKTWLKEQKEKVSQSLRNSGFFRQRLYSNQYNQPGLFPSQSLRNSGLFRHFQDRF